MVVAGVGIWYPVIGVSGAGHGFRRTAPPTAATELGPPTAVVEVLTAVGNRHTADGNPTAAGKAHTEARADTGARLITLTDQFAVRAVSARLLFLAV